MSEVPSVVSAQWLAQHGQDSDLVVVDASVHLPDTGRDAEAEYLVEHIPGAVFFDLSVIADPTNPLPRKVPPAERFAEEVGRLGIGEGTHVIAYDTPGLYSAARGWWLFRLFGHERVSILDGGMVAWKASGGPLQSERVTRSPTSFPFRPRGERFATWDDVAHAIGDSSAQILDARTPGRFAGTEEDRYPGTRIGHIPGSLNLYWADLLDPESKTLLPLPEIEAKLVAAGVSDEAADTVLTCGSGLTACILALAMDLTGRSRWQVYDGSWDEWGRRDDLPVTLGPPGSPGA